MKKLYNSRRLSLIVRIATIHTIAIFCTATALWAQCSVAGTGNTTGNVNFGSSNNWANPNRANLSDDLYARVNLANGEISKYLEVSDYGWVIPPGATIQGIEVNIECHQEDLVADFADASIVLMKAGVAASADRAGTGVYDDKDLINTYGSSTDMWGTTWTPADVMDPGFGVLYSVTRLSGPGTYYLFVDYVELTVYYTGSGCILPVTYRAYNVVLQSNETVKIDWITSAETQCDHYAVERSQDGTDFERIGTIAAQGNAETENEYAFYDDALPIGTSYYRLQQVDRNGQAAFTEVRSITRGGDAQFAITAFPNPAQDHLRIQGPLAGGNVTLYDLNGKLVLLAAPAADAVTLDVSGLAPGIYMLQAANHGSHTSQRILIE
jgi:Secretion system C-terminal sorting domain